MKGRDNAWIFNGSVIWRQLPCIAVVFSVVFFSTGCLKMRVDQINKLNDQKALREIAPTDHTDTNVNLRNPAIERLEDQAALVASLELQLGKYKEDVPPETILIISKLKDQSKLLELALKDNRDGVRYQAIVMLKNRVDLELVKHNPRKTDSHLADLALALLDSHVPDTFIQVKCEERSRQYESKKELARYLRTYHGEAVTVILFDDQGKSRYRKVFTSNFPSELTVYGGGGDLGFKEAEIDVEIILAEYLDQVMKPQEMMDLAIEGKSIIARRAAIDCISSEALLINIAEKVDTPELRRISLKKLTQSTLAKVVLNNTNDLVRQDVIPLLLDSPETTQIFELLALQDGNELNRHEAVSRLKNVSVLEDVLLRDCSDIVLAEAMARLVEIGRMPIQKTPMSVSAESATPQQVPKITWDDNIKDDELSRWKILVSLYFPDSNEKNPLFSAGSNKSEAIVFSDAVQLAEMCDARNAKLWQLHSKTMPMIMAAYRKERQGCETIVFVTDKDRHFEMAAEDIRKLLPSKGLDFFTASDNKGQNIGLPITTVQHAALLLKYMGKSCILIVNPQFPSDVVKTKDVLNRFEVSIARSMGRNWSGQRHHYVVAVGSDRFIRPTDRFEIPGRKHYNMSELIKAMIKTSPILAVEKSIVESVLQRPSGIEVTLVHEGNQTKIDNLKVAFVESGQTVNKEQLIGMKCDDN